MVDESLEESSRNEEVSGVQVFKLLSVVIACAVLFVFILYYLSEVIPNNELKGKDMNSVDGTIVILIHDKVKTISNNEIAYFVSVDPMVFPWHPDLSFKRVRMESLVPVTKEQFEELKVNSTYQFYYHKTINEKDKTPVIRQYKEI